MMRIIQNVYIYLTCSLLIVLMGLVFYMSFFPFEVMHVTRQPLPMIKKELQRGDPVEYVVEMCKFMDIGGTITTSIVGDTTTIINTEYSNRSKGCVRTISSRVFIPEHIESGTYHLNIVVTYNINPFQSKTYRFNTESFNVL